jgi:hypothetical protein
MVNEDGVQGWNPHEEDNALFTPLSIWRIFIGKR